MMSSRHQIIEASAGTGKTYTIENKVVDLIVNEGIPLTQLLIVTFTEKATGELRRRVREKLESEWQKNNTGANADFLRASIDAFDDAEIYTIHGFCKRMLSEYAFETKLPFNQQQLEDPQIMDRLFSRSLRGYWRRHILTDDDPERRKDAYDGKFYRNSVQSVAKRYMPGDEIVPNADSKMISTTDALKNIIATLEQTFGIIPDDINNSAFMNDFSAIKMHGSTKSAMAPGFISFMTTMRQYQQDNRSDAAAAGFLSWMPYSSFLGKLSPLIDAKLLREEDANAFSMLLRLKDEIQGNVKSHAVMQLYESLRRYKRDGGFIDFNDMLLMTREALLHPSSPLIDILRRRYRVALVDEFQDTDQVQWDIFNAIFTGDDNHRLIVVGDPKQAIYSFRGANVKIYTNALKQLNSNGAEQSSLDTNWRSYPPLITVLNNIFNTNSEWFEDTGTDHHDIKAPDASKVRARLYADDSGRHPLTVVDLADFGGSKARYQFSRFIAREIKHLLNSNIEIVEWHGDTARRRPLHPGDFCILISARSELPVIKRALRDANIPYTFPKQGGLFATTEAEEWRYLLRAIANPDDSGAVMTALLTRFFNCGPEKLDGYQLLHTGHPLKMLIAKWHHMADNRQWAHLFQSVFADTGILERELPGDDGERVITNHQHLVQILHEQAIRCRGNIDDLVLFLDNKCLRKDDEDTDLQRIETERRKVKIMTMHGSKGLEFEIVFIAGGFTPKKPRGDVEYSTEKGRKYIFNKNKDETELQKKEDSADARRLYYVALTRAKYKLYIPYMGLKKGGALNDFVKNAIDTAFNGDIPEMINAAKIDYNNDKATEKWTAVLDDASGVELPAADGGLAGIDESLISLPVINHEWGQRTNRVHSFSSLHVNAEPAAEMPVLQFAADDTAGDTRQIITDDAAETGIMVSKEDDDLPHGAETGTLLHAVLEEINYAEVSGAASYNDLLREDSSVRAVITQMLDKYPLVGDAATLDYRDKIARIVWNALNTPMPFLNGAKLSAVTERRHEMEFWIKKSDGDYLSGFIDLIFRHDGKYYILDWKSNWSPGGDYSQPALTKMIDSHEYNLQYGIYTLALDKFLRLSMPGYDPVIHLGGVCYLFLRGVGVGGDGIYYVPASDIDISAIDSDVADRIASIIAEAR